MSRKAATHDKPKSRGGKRQGAGRPETGRNQPGPKISESTRQILQQLAHQWQISKAEALERAVAAVSK